jgi:hypothetical protein
MAFASRAILLGTALVLSTTAVAVRADCVDFDPKRAKVAGAALARNPPTAAQLGLPDLDGLTIDGPRTTGDPKCDGPGPYKRFYFTSSIPFADLIARWYPNLRPRTEVDGMKREWFRNPRSGGSFALTSGTRVETIFDGPERNGRIALLNIMPAARMAPLTVSNQPYTVAEVIEGTPWPGGANGPRLFVRADQDGAVAPPVAASPAPAPVAGTVPAPVAGAAPAPAATPPSAVNCPPRQAQGGAAEGQRAGAEVGGAILGGGWGRSLGAALGGALGSVTGGAQGTQRPAADPNCP